MKKAQAKRSRPKPTGLKERVAKHSASKPLTPAPQPRPRKHIESVTGEVGRPQWKVTRSKYDVADTWDIKRIQTDLETLARQCDLIRDLAEEQAKRLDHLETRLVGAESATKQVGADLVLQLDELKRLLGGATISQALKSLCEQQLAAIDKRMAELTALATRVRELVKDRAGTHPSQPHSYQP